MNISTNTQYSTCDLYFTILVDVFTNRIVPENKFFKLYRVNRPQDYGLGPHKQVPFFTVPAMTN